MGVMAHIQGTLYASESGHSRGMALNQEMAQGLNVTVAMMFSERCLSVHPIRGN